MSILFDVRSHDCDGNPVTCSHCGKEVPQVIALPVTDRPGSSNGLPSEAWLGLCLPCIELFRIALRRPLA